MNTVYTFLLVERIDCRLFLGFFFPLIFFSFFSFQLQAQLQRAEVLLSALLHHERVEVRFDQNGSAIAGFVVDTIIFCCIGRGHGPVRAQR